MKNHQNLTCENGFFLSNAKRLKGEKCVKVCCSLHLHEFFMILLRNFYCRFFNAIHCQKCNDMNLDLVFARVQVERPLCIINVIVPYVMPLWAMIDVLSTKNQQTYKCKRMIIIHSLSPDPTQKAPRNLSSSYLWKKTKKLQKAMIPYIS